MFSPQDEIFDDDDTHPQTSEDKPGVFSPAPMQSSAPSPEVYKGFRQDLPETAPPLTSNSRAYKSTRIPDFTQWVYKMRQHAGQMLDNPPVYMKRIVLLVEIKRKPLTASGPMTWLFSKILIQTGEQARHAFAACPEVNTIGVIVAIGDLWTYREYRRQRMGTSPSRSEQEDPTFTPSSSAAVPRPDEKYQPVNYFFGNKGFVRLQEVGSDNALKAVRKRNKELYSSLW